MLTISNLSVSSKTTIIIILFSIFVLLMVSCENQLSVRVYESDAKILEVPSGDGRPVMTDGMFQPGEWDDASKLIINDSISILFKQYQGHLYLALDSRELLSPVIDLFLCTDSTNIVHLHVSAQLGERFLCVAPAISEDTLWVWGRTSDWYANEFRWIYQLQDSLVNIAGLDWETAIKQSGFPHEAIEMDLLQSKIGGNSWLFRIEIWTARATDKPFSFPPDTKFDNLDGWASFELN